MESLINKKCTPCEGAGRAFTADEVKDRLPEIPGWSMGFDGKTIERAMTLKNFIACVNFINKIKDIAEDEMHHPDLHLTGYKNLKVVLYTHALGGVTENDLIVAAKINQQLMGSHV
ncbi:MAG: 4a-hydroxytetrahydrobiopterin dehydratase [Candidatus Omnitrophica bacterium]|nr:4a-hydroxytetrahydrobiopterin dehydratase [Candidatus Omnitrophota bacterium]MDE2009354.1 4a-hydroxytetrahydrobiopterin dehydratase [Candidatus Omnitrophota bacterium]MDE2214138.1 4a-hydroxytetrahydrobiopterin dehydratase [Candidatus Omnitrophota bacterium]MDE2231175.1 4a-hydroxytetrahydrobiopterin dehydratase [Candidatus Omnitrophota bacterium]